MCCVGVQPRSANYKLYYTTNYGVTWTFINSGHYFTDICYNYSGSILYSCTTTQGIFKSNDYGVSWTSINSQIGNFNNIRCSYDGKKIYLTETGGGTWYSSNSGITITKIFETTSQNNQGLGVSANGRTSVVVISGNSSTDSVYISTDYGVTYNSQDLTDIISESSLSWTAVASNQYGKTFYATISYSVNGGVY